MEITNREPLHELIDFGYGRGASRRGDPIGRARPTAYPSHPHSICRIDHRRPPQRLAQTVYVVGKSDPRKARVGRIRSPTALYVVVESRYRHHDGAPSIDCPLMATLAEFERDLLRKRVRSGIAPQGNAVSRSAVDLASESRRIVVLKLGRRRPVLSGNQPSARLEQEYVLDIVKRDRAAQWFPTPTSCRATASRKQRFDRLTAGH